MSMSIQCFETVLIFNGKLTEEEYDEKVRCYKKWLKGLPAARIRTEKKGKKKLAYEVGGCEYGYYVLFIYESTGDLINSKLNLMLRKDDDVVKFLTLAHEGEYTPDEDDENIKPASIKSEQRKKPVDVFNLIFGLED